MGLDPSLLIAGDFVLVRHALVDALDGDFPAAILLQRIQWRCERDGAWAATRLDLERETRLSEWQVKRALKLLLDRGYIVAERASAWDSTKVWRVVLDSPSRDGGILHPELAEPSTRQVAESSIPSSQTAETKDETKNPPAADAAELGFPEFWALAVRKTGKGDALAKWRKLAPDVRMVALQAWTIAVAAWATWPEDRRSFIPHPATWLGQRRWEDEPPQAYRATAAQVDRTAAKDHWSSPGAGW